MNLQRKCLAIAVGALSGSTAVAQDIRVSVTGSNIKRADTETAAPIQTITREDIQQSGLQTIQEVVRQITTNNNGQISPSWTGGFSPSSTAVSLRGLGSNNTLVLLNGRRLATFGLPDDGHVSYVDLSQIPFDAVERIEVLKDGASAIYGSDTVAGVVNVILRQQFTGVSVTTYGVNGNGEGNQYKAAVTAGLGDLTKYRYNAFGRRVRKRQRQLQLRVLGRDGNAVQPGSALHVPIAGGVTPDHSRSMIGDAARHAGLAGSESSRPRSCSRSRNRGSSPSARATRSPTIAFAIGVRWLLSSK